MQQGIAKTPKEAWDEVRRSRSDPEKSEASIYKKWLDTLKPEYGSVKDPGALHEEAMRLTKETMRMLDGGADTPAETKPVAVKRPAGVDDAAIIKQAQDAIAGGADKAAVRARLLEMGIEPAAAGL